MPDQPFVAQLGQHAEVLGERIVAVHPQVHHVEVVAAELAQVLLDLAAQLVRRGERQPLAGRVATRPHLGHDDQLVGVRRQRGVDQLVGRPGRGEVERGGVDVVDAQLDGATQDPDGPVAPARGTAVEYAAAGQSHRAEANRCD